jgi:quinol monooxygenase YgiN
MTAGMGEDDDMVIVMGTFELVPGESGAFVASREDTMRVSRTEAGCLEYTFAVDPLDPDRVVLTERWESQEHLDAHLLALRAAEPAPAPVTPVSASIVIYTVAGEHRLV